MLEQASHFKPVYMPLLDDTSCCDYQKWQNILRHDLNIIAECHQNHVQITVFCRVVLSALSSTSHHATPVLHVVCMGSAHTGSTTAFQAPKKKSISGRGRYGDSELCVTSVLGLQCTPFNVYSIIDVTFCLWHEQSCCCHLSYTDRVHHYHLHLPNL